MDRLSECGSCRPSLRRARPSMPHEASRARWSAIVAAAELASELASPILDQGGDDASDLVTLPRRFMAVTAATSRRCARVAVSKADRSVGTVLMHGSSDLLCRGAGRLRGAAPISSSSRQIMPENGRGELVASRLWSYRIEPYPGVSNEPADPIVGNASQ